MSAGEGTVQVLCDVMNERLRQALLRDQGKFGATCADSSMTDAECLVVLAEEFGEVARAIQEDRLGLREELIQVAAVAVAWVERLDRSGSEWGGPNDPED